jgi:hypothetical protein
VYWGWGTKYGFVGEHNSALNSMYVAVLSVIFYCSKFQQRLPCRDHLGHDNLVPLPELPLPLSWGGEGVRILWEVNDR